MLLVVPNSYDYRLSIATSHSTKIDRFALINTLTHLFYAAQSALGAGQNGEEPPHLMQANTQEHHLKKYAHSKHRFTAQKPRPQIEKMLAFQTLHLQSTSEMKASTPPTHF
jgi:hypothetical protein